MSERQLIIFVSDTLRRADFLGLSPGVTEVLVVGERKLTVEEEPAFSKLKSAADPWETKLRDVLINKIQGLENWRSARVRIACHLTTCFPHDPRVFRKCDQRFHEKEEILKQGLDYDLDVQVWGFHHEEYSPLWRTVVQVKEISKATEEETKINFLLALEGIFQTGAITVKVDLDIGERQRLWEHLSVVKHQIMNFLGPLRLTLQTAIEKRAENPAKADEKLSAINRSLDSKLPEARRMLEECRRVASTGESRVTWEAASRHLTKRPDLEAFAPWLDELNDSLTKLRDSIKKND